MANPDGLFPHERMEVFQLAVRLQVEVRPVVDRLRRFDRSLADQLQRAVSSIGLNIAEGAGEYSPRDKARFYRYAVRSSLESAAALKLAEAIVPQLAGSTPGPRSILLRLFHDLTHLTLFTERKAEHPRRAPDPPRQEAARS